MEPTQQTNQTLPYGSKMDDPGMIEKAAPAHLENVSEEKSPEDWMILLENAVEAEAAERDMGLKAALRKYPKAVFWSFCMSLCIVMEGYDTALLGGLTGLSVFRQKYGFYAGKAKGYQLNPAWQTALGQASTVGSILGIFAASWLQERIGYKRTIQGSLILMAAFVFIVFFSPTVEVLFVGELLCGLPWGAFSSAAVSYASEITPVALRGYLTTYVNLCWVIGQFIAAGVLLGLQGRQDEWAYKIPFAVQWIWPVPLFILVTLAPESPWWRVRRGELEKAEKAVRQLSSDKAIDATKTVAMMVRTNQHEIDNQPGVSFFDCFKGTDLRRTEIACVAWGIQKLCGSSFGNQGVFFFEQAGLVQADAFKFTLGQYAIGFIGTCSSWITMTYCGRRKTYLSGLSMMCLLLLIIGFLAIPSANGNPNAKWGQAGLILCWVFTYDFTIGPLAYCVVGEISSTRLRVKTVGLSRAFYNIIGIVAGILNTYMINPTAWNWKGFEAFFWLVSCMGCVVWTYFRLPEAKGRSYRELDILFEQKVPARKFRSTPVALQSVDGRA